MIPAETAIPLPMAESIPDADFWSSTPQPEAKIPEEEEEEEELTGSALPHTAPNLRVSLSRNKLLDGSSERERQGFSGGCPALPVLEAATLPASRSCNFFLSAERRLSCSADAPDALLSDSNSGIF